MIETIRIKGKPDEPVEKEQSNKSSLRFPTVTQ